MEAPTVMMMRAMGFELLAGRMNAIKRYYRHAAKHDKLALGEVDDLGGIVNDGKTQGDNRIDGTVGDAGDNILQNLATQIHSQKPSVQSELKCPKRV
jgi:hypothetical protein